MKRQDQQTAGSSARLASTAFTLIELLVVIAILGLMTNMIMPSLMDDVPETEIRAEANKLATRLSFLRSEARLQGETYGIEIDNRKGRYRITGPAEKILVRDNEDTPKALQLSWVYLPEQVYFSGIQVGQGADANRAETRIDFDARGRTPQRILYLSHRSDKKLLYSVVVPPLTGLIEVTKDKVFFPTAFDSDF